MSASVRGMLVSSGGDLQWLAWWAILRGSWAIDRKCTITPDGGAARTSDGMVRGVRSGSMPHAMDGPTLRRRGCPPRLGKVLVGAASPRGAASLWAPPVAPRVGPHLPDSRHRPLPGCPHDETIGAGTSSFTPVTRTGMAGPRWVDELFVVFDGASSIWPDIVALSPPSDRSAEAPRPWATTGCSADRRRPTNAEGGTPRPPTSAHCFDAAANSAPGDTARPIGSSRIPRAPESDLSGPLTCTRWRPRGRCPQTWRRSGRPAPRLRAPGRTPPRRSTAALTTGLGVRDMATATGLSRAHLIRRFREPPDSHRAPSATTAIDGIAPPVMDAPPCESCPSVHHVEVSV